MRNEFFFILLYFKNFETFNIFLIVIGVTSKLRSSTIFTIDIILFDVIRQINLFVASQVFDFQPFVCFSRNYFDLRISVCKYHLSFDASSNFTPVQAFHQQHGYLTLFKCLLIWMRYKNNIIKKYCTQNFKVILNWNFKITFPQSFLHLNIF